MPKLRFGTFIGPKAVIVTAVVLALMVGTAWAAHRPTPLMDYAPQETAIYDTYYDYLMEEDCRYCHGVSLADRHHFNESALLGDCTLCHIVGPPPDYGVTVYRDCRYAGADVACHYDFSNGWHHNTYLADSDQCTACHNPQILGELGPFQDPTLYPPTVVTPSPFSCENCHWEQLADTVNGYVHPSTDIHYDPWGVKIANLTQNAAAGFIVQPDELSMDVGGVTNDGWAYSTDKLGAPRPAGWEKDIRGNMDTHHMDWHGTVAAKCANCHANDPGDPSWDPNDPILIRYCERCHDIASLHRIAGHVDQVEIWNGFMYGNNERAWEAAELNGYNDARIYRAFTGNERCVGCHGDGLSTYEPPYDCTTAPVISSISPNAGEPGAVVVITGTGFGEDVTEVPGVGKAAIEMSGTGTGGVWVSLPIVSWTNTEVSFRLPAWVFPVGNYMVRVSALVLTGPACDVLALVSSNLVGFTVTDHPTLTDIGTSVNPADDDAYAYGPYYSTVRVIGTGGLGAASIQTVGSVNIFSQVILTGSAGAPPGGGPAGALVVADSSQTWNAGTKNSISSWSDTRIDFQLKWLWCDVNGDYLQNTAEAPYVDPEDVFVGDYDVRVRSVYWVDKNLNSKPDQPNPADPEDPANEYTQVCVSDPVRLNLTNDPQIWKMKPSRVTKGSAVSIIGANFGTMQHDSVVTIYKKDGVTVEATLAAGNAKIRLWSNTKIRFKTTGLTKGVKWAKVTVGGIDSNLKKFRVI